MDIINKKKYNYFIIILTNGVILTSILSLNFYSKKIKKLYFDPHIWIPWKNTKPWKNNIKNWWHNKNIWNNNNPWKNIHPWINKNPWVNKKK